jgi:uracil-DNA glycosylase
VRTIEDLIADVRREATRAEFPVDRPVYDKANKDPADPVLFAGSLAAPVCVFGRDLGKDEVAHGQPLVGAGGKLVRKGLLRAFAPGPLPSGDDQLEAALAFALLTNTVPYKPPGNKAYPDKVKERFRPFVAELLARFWSGDRVLCLGTEAFQWFARYAEPGAADEFWTREDRYEADFPCVVEVISKGETLHKPIVVCPLPHPSPLNQRWYGRFPGLLDARLAQAGSD